MTTLEDVLPFVRAIADNPGHQPQRLAFASWLESRGLDAEATGQRWAAHHYKYPEPPLGGRVVFGGWHVEGVGYRSRDAHKLPRLFWPLRGTPLRITDPFHSERWFLHACGLVQWDNSGNPIGRREGYDTEQDDEWSWERWYPDEGRSWEHD
jgi:uncharacterized protein (TIGR02996 family)